MVEVIIIVCLAGIFYIVLRRMPEVEKIEVQSSKKEKDRGIIESLQNFADKFTKKQNKNKIQPEMDEEVKEEDLLDFAEKKLARGDLDGAEKAYLKLATLHPKDGKIFESLGSIYYQKQEYEDSIHAYKAALNRNKSNGFNYYNLAMSLYKLKRNSEARTCFEKSIELNNKIGIRHVGLGMCLLRLDEPREAVRSFERAIELEPHNEKYKNLLDQAISKLSDRNKLKNVS